MKKQLKFVKNLSKLSAILIVFALLQTFPLIAQSAESGKKIALLIGNNRYSHIGTLDKPINDATDLSQALKNLGFEVMLKTDADKSALEAAISEFGQKAQSANVAMLFYSGHGLQVAGENILVPVDYDLNKPEGGVSANAIQKVMQNATKGTKLLILDACRNDPSIGKAQTGRKGLSRSTGKSRAVATGLAPMVKTDEFYIAFATAAGETAADGTGRNSPYTSALLEHIQEPIPIEILFKKVRASVKEKTNQVQVPAEYSSLTGDFCFTGCGVEITDTSNTCHLKIGQGNYEGECENGKANGQGIQRYADGEYYAGGFKDNLRQGNGKQYLIDGTVIEGTWERGRMAN